MNRRSFLSSMFAVSAAGLLVPTTSYFFAPKGGWVSPKYLAEFTGVIHPDYVKIVICRYADYACDIWDMTTGRHYDLMKMDDLVAAQKAPDSFVRNMALFQAEGLPPSGYMGRLSR